MSPPKMGPFQRKFHLPTINPLENERLVHLQITQLTSGKSSEPNLHDFGFQPIIFQGVFRDLSVFQSQLWSLFSRRSYRSQPERDFQGLRVWLDDSPGRKAEKMGFTKRFRSDQFLQVLPHTCRVNLHTSTWFFTHSSYLKSGSRRLPQSLPGTLQEFVLHLAPQVEEMSLQVAVTSGISF